MHDKNFSIFFAHLADFPLLKKDDRGPFSLCYSNSATWPVLNTKLAFVNKA